MSAAERLSAAAARELLDERIEAAIERINRTNREARQLVDVSDDEFGPPQTFEDYKRDMAEELGMHDVDAEHYASWLEYDARNREAMLPGLRLDARAAEIGDIDNPLEMERLDLDPDDPDDCATYSGYVRRWVKKQNAQAAPAVDPAFADAVRAELRVQLGDEGFEAWRHSVFALRDVLVEEEVADYAGQPLAAPPRLAHAWSQAVDAFARLARYPRLPDTRPRPTQRGRGRRARRRTVRPRVRSGSRGDPPDDPDPEPDDELDRARLRAGLSAWSRV
jgi:hypothetical protein